MPESKNYAIIMLDSKTRAFGRLCRLSSVSIIVAQLFTAYDIIFKRQHWE